MTLCKERTIFLFLFTLTFIVLIYSILKKSKEEPCRDQNCHDNPDKDLLCWEGEHDEDPPVLVQFQNGNNVEGMTGDTIEISSPVASISIPAKMCVHLYREGCEIGSKNCEIVDVEKKHYNWMI